MENIDWETEELGYAQAVEQSEYHSLRRLFLLDLLPNLEGKFLIDFGCGEGLLLKDAAALKAAGVLGIDPSAALLAHARERLTINAELLEGSVELLANVPSQSIDVVCAFNVLAYMTTTEADLFYSEACRVLKPNGHLCVTHSNVLFDLFSLNRYTVRFFAENFQCDIANHLGVESDFDLRSYSIRENPLTYPTALERYGFHTEFLRYFNFHACPPIDGRPGTQTAYHDAWKGSVPDSTPMWIQMFQCSTFGARAIKVA